MKASNLLYILIALLSLIGCNNDNSGLLDPNATIKIRPGLQLRSAGEHLSPIDIVKQTDGMSFQFEDATYGRGFSDAQRDTIDPCLKMWGTDIIDQEGNYHARFIEGSDCVLIRVHNKYTENEWIDTIGYVPNTILQNAQIRIKAAYDNEDYTTCYQVFDSAFVFIPISGEEWRDLKDMNMQ